MSSVVARSATAVVLLAGGRGGGGGVDGASDALGDRVRVEVAWRVRCDPADTSGTPSRPGIHWFPECAWVCPVPPRSGHTG